MKRREFITLLGGAAAAGRSRRARSRRESCRPSGSWARARLRPWSQWTAAFVQRLRELGWIEGRTIAIEYRWAEGRSERYAEIAAEFVRLKVDVIVTSGTAVSRRQSRRHRSSRSSSRRRPTRLAAASSRVLARPGGNVTGLSIQQTDLAGKRLELLREVVPGLRRLAIMANVGYPACVLEMGEVQAAARTLGLEVATLEIRRAEDIAPAFEALKGRADALYVCTRPARNHQPHSHQHLGARRATADDVTASASTSKREV